MAARRGWWLATALLAGTASAGTPVESRRAPGEAPRLALRAAQLERAPEGTGRFQVRARLAREATAGELREGREFVLLGRLAKAGAAACGSHTLFRDGFEGS